VRGSEAAGSGVPESYDAVVVGAGPAGSATASLLAGQGRSVLLLDAAHFPRAKACAEYISPGGVAILQRLGAFETLDLGQTGRWLDGMRIIPPSGASHLVTYGQRHHALSVPRRALDMALLELARGHGAHVREGFRVQRVWREGRQIRGVVGAAGERIEAGLVVGADGLQSVVAGALRLRRPARWPRRLGLTVHLAGVAWPAAHGEMWVGRHGYVGVAPLDDHGLLSVGAVLPLPRPAAHRATRGGSEPAMARLQAALAEFPALARRLATGRPVEPVRGAGPLAQRVRANAGPGFALVGDAAGFFDPFTGEGIFRALRGAELVAADLARYPAARAGAFGPKERLTALIQLFVQVPALLEVAVRRLEARPHLARRLGAILGDLEPASLDVALRLLLP